MTEQTPGTAPELDVDEIERRAREQLGYHRTTWGNEPSPNCERCAAMEELLALVAEIKRLRALSALPEETGRERLLLLARKEQRGKKLETGELQALYNKHYGEARAKLTHEAAHEIALFAVYLRGRLSPFAGASQRAAESPSTERLYEIADEVRRWGSLDNAVSYLREVLGPRPAPEPPPESPQGSGKA